MSLKGIWSEIRKQLINWFAEWTGADQSFTNFMEEFNEAMAYDLAQYTNDLPQALARKNEAKG